MADLRIGIVYDDQVRPDTTGVYCYKAMREVANVSHFHPSQLAFLHESDFDLFLYIDDGLRHDEPRLRPAAWWAIDTHLDFQWYRSKASDYDLVFTAQKDAAAILQKEHDHVIWLPLAADADIHCLTDGPKEFDVCFVGNEFPGDRQDILDAVRTNFPNNFIGRRFFEEMAKTYGKSRIVVNRSIRNDVNMRMWYRRSELAHFGRFVDARFGCLGAMVSVEA